MSPTSTADYPQLQATAVLPMLAPASASARLLAAASSLDLAGVATIKLPFIGASGRPAVRSWPKVVQALLLIWRYQRPS